MLGVAVMLTLAISLSAQTTTPAPAGSDAGMSGANEEVLTLPEFSVSGTAEGSYVPSEDAAGARIKTPLKELPYAVTTLNSEFFKDFGIWDLTTDMSYFASLQGSDLSGGQVLRGFNGNNTQLRNGFAALGVRSTVALDNISIILGPAAMIYGQTSPGGTVFYNTLKPTVHPTQGIRETVGSGGTNATNAYISGPIPIGSKPTVFYRFDVEDYGRRFQDQVNRNLTREWLATLMYKPNENTNFVFDGGYQVTEQNPNQALPYLFNIHANNAAGLYQYYGFAYQIKNKYYSTPVDYRIRQRNTAEGFLEQRISDWLVFKAGANVYKYPNYTYSSFNGTSQFDPTTNSIINHNAHVSWSQFTGFGESYTGEFLANYHWGPTRHTTLLTFDYYNNIRRNEIGASSIAAYPTSVPVINPPLYPAQPVNSQFFTYTVPAASSKPLPTMTNGHTTASGSFAKLNESVPASGIDIAHEAFFFDDKLMLTAAYRHDYYRVYAKDDYWGITSKIHGNNDAVESGISYGVTKDVNVYVDETEGFLPPGTSTAMYTDVPKTTSIGYEAGVKGALLDNLLNFTLDVYKDRQLNVQETALDPTDPTNQRTITVYSGTVNSQGLESVINWHINDRAYVYASYAYTDNRYANQGVNVLANGLRQAGVPRHAFAGAFRYQLLTGLSAYVTMRYASDAPTANQNTGWSAPAGSKLATINNGQAFVFSPAFVVWNLGVQYKFKTTRYLDLSHSVSFDVKNIFNKQYIIPGGDRYLGDPVGFYLTYSLSH